MVRLLIVVLFFASCTSKQNESANDNKAFDNIDFGITKTEFDSLREIKYEIGGYDFYTDGKFTDQGLLHTFILDSGPIDDFESERLVSLKNAIDLKYGEGKTMNESTIDGYGFLNQWVIGDKEIRVGFKVLENGNQKILCWISNKELLFENMMKKEQEKLNKAENDKELF